ncbi:MAG: polysaccharide biosynthesis C-terminal domain-containing protein [Kiritimatiellia bacterium]
MRLTFQVNLVDNALRLLLCLLVYQATGSVRAMVLALGAAALAAAGSGRLLQNRHLPAAVAGSGADAGALARYSVPVFFMSVAGFISTEIDTLMIGGLLDDRATGIFGLPKQLVAFLPHVSVAFTMGAVPALARMAAQADPAARTGFRRLLGLLAVLYGGLALAGFALAAWLPREWLPQGYRESVGPFAGLMPYVFFNALSIFTGTLLNYRGLAGRRFLFLVVTILLNVTLNRWWIPRFGVTGAALASSVAMMPYFLLNWIQCERMLRPARPSP